MLNSILKIQRTIPSGEFEGSATIMYAQSFSTPSVGNITESDLNVPLHVEQIDITANFEAGVVTSGTAYIAVKEGVSGSQNPPTSLEGWSIVGNGAVIGNDGKANFISIPVTENGAGFSLCAFTYKGGTTIVPSTPKNVTG
ncbi:MAG: hypothetical protein FWG98_06745 [Candidatus Cloacimonetes bacterium]|nr:hypothetical protein [Candidatus Cloacimonadota bacterium]